MDRFTTFIFLFVILTAATASSISLANFNDGDAVSSYHSRAAAIFTKDGKAYPPDSLVIKMACVVDTLDLLSVQYRTQALWHGLQTK